MLGARRLSAHLALTAPLFVAMFAAYTYFAALLEGVAGFGERETALALFGFGIAGLAGNWLADRGAERDATRATAAAALALGIAQFAASTASGRGPLLALAVWGAAHAALFVLCHLRAMHVAPQAPAFAGALNISVCNIGIAAGAPRADKRSRCSASRPPACWVRPWRSLRSRSRSSWSQSEMTRKI
ncbi:MAG TPA: hypothetical protein VF203_00365 [Burkholderiales bacterium]